MEIYTIGFTQTTAEHFFDRLIQAKVKRLVDVRLKNNSQLSAFAKTPDIEFFLDRVAGISYRHEELLAPTKELLSDYRKGELGWSGYEQGFLSLLAERQVEKLLKPGDFKEPTALLCSEPTAECCHRRLVCEYLTEHWGDLGGEHL